VADLPVCITTVRAKRAPALPGCTVLDSRELIVLAVTGTYLQVIAAQSRVDTARAQIATAQVTYTQAVDRNKSGLNARIDVNRSLVELQTQQQLLNSLTQRSGQTEIIVRPAHWFAAVPVNLADRCAAVRSNGTVSGLDEMIRFAWDQRPDVRAAGVQVHAAEEARRAATSESLPSLSFNADYGVIGVNPAQSHGTFSVTGNLHVPIFRSGRIKADVEAGKRQYSPSAAPNSKTFAGALNRTYAMPNSMSIPRPNRFASPNPTAVSRRRRWSRQKTASPQALQNS